MLCPRCGHQISPKVKWCPYCAYTFPRPAWLLPLKLLSALGAVALVVVFFAKGLPYLRFEKDYMAAIQMMEQHQYGEAEAVFLEMPRYKDAPDFVEECQYGYASAFDSTAAGIYVNGYVAQLVCGQISSTWSDAIRSSGKDFNTEIRLYLSMWKNTETYEMTEELNSTIEEAMYGLRTPTSDYAEAFPLLLELYGTYTELYAQSVSPTGSLVTYNAKVDELCSALERSFSQLRVIKPQIEGDPSGLLDGVLDEI